MTVKEALEAAGFKSEFGQVTMKADVEIELTGDDAARMQKLIDVLESLDDVQDVYTNAAMGE
jgi:transcriptional/translational regulatory protein YebC/TACO1